MVFTHSNVDVQSSAAELEAFRIPGKLNKTDVARSYVLKTPESVSFKSR